MFLQTDLQFFATSYQNTNAKWFFEQQGILMRQLCYLIRLGQMRQLCDLGRLVPMRQLCHLIWLTQMRRVVSFDPVTQRRQLCALSWLGQTRQPKLDIVLFEPV